MKGNKLNTVHVKFENPAYNYSTDVSCNTTESSAKEYFVGRWFNIEPFPSEKTAKVKSIEFVDNNK